MDQTSPKVHRICSFRGAPRIVLWLGVLSLLGCGEVAGGSDASFAQAAVPGRQENSGNTGMPRPPRLAYRGEQVEVHQLIYEGWGPPGTCPDGNFCVAVHKADLDANCVFYKASACVNDQAPAEPWAPCKFYDETSRVLEPDTCFALKKQIFEHRPLTLPDTFHCDVSGTCSSDETTFNLEFVVSGHAKKVSFETSAYPIFTADFRALRALVEELGFY